MVSEILQPMKHPDLLSITLGVTEEVNAVKSGHGRASGGDVGFPFMGTGRNHFVEQGDNALDLLDQILGVLICALGVVGPMF